MTKKNRILALNPDVVELIIYIIKYKFINFDFY